MRTFSKIYGLASLRLGWSYSSSYVASILNRARGPFNVSGAAQSAGIAAINDEEFLGESKSHNNKWLKIIADELDKIGIKHYPSVANFVLIDFLSPDKCKQVNQLLLDSGVILREMTSYSLPNCLRMTIGKDEENLLVIKLLNQFTKN
jgi:histidinol-phosphate aminotransferase